MRRLLSRLLQSWRWTQLLPHLTGEETGSARWGLLPRVSHSSQVADLNLEPLMENNKLKAGAAQGNPDAWSLHGWWSPRAFPITSCQFQAFWDMGHFSPDASGLVPSTIVQFPVSLASLGSDVSGGKKEGL